MATVLTVAIVAGAGRRGGLPAPGGVATPPCGGRAASSSSSSCSPTRSRVSSTASQGDLDDNPQVEEYRYLDQEEAYEEFQQLFRDQPDVTDTVRPEDLPTSFRVVPENPRAEVVELAPAGVRAEAGVLDVVAATEDIQTMQETFGRLSIGIIVAGRLPVGARRCC